MAPRSPPSPGLRRTPDRLVRLTARDDGRYQEHEPQEPEERSGGLGLTAGFLAGTRGTGYGVMECSLLRRGLTTASRAS